MLAQLQAERTRRQQVERQLSETQAQLAAVQAILHHSNRTGAPHSASRANNLNAPSGGGPGGAPPSPSQQIEAQLQQTQAQLQDSQHEVNHLREQLDAIQKQLKPGHQSQTPQGDPADTDKGTK